MLTMSLIYLIKINKEKWKNKNVLYILLQFLVYGGVTHEVKSQIATDRDNNYCCHTRLGEEVTRQSIHGEYACYFLYISGFCLFFAISQPNARTGPRARKTISLRTVRFRLGFSLFRGDSVMLYVSRPVSPRFLAPDEQSIFGRRTVYHTGGRRRRSVVIL